MSVFDASVVVNALIAPGPQGEASMRLLEQAPQITGPEILKAEATSALRRLDLNGTLAAHATIRAVDRINRLQVQTYPIEPLLGRIWELRNTLTVYDAWYVALAERLDTTLFTADRRLANAPGPLCEITVVTVA